MTDRLHSREVLERPENLGLDLLEILEDETIEDDGLNRLRNRLTESHGTYKDLTREMVVDSISELLLKQNMEASQQEAINKLLPYISNGESRPNLIISSAATASGAWNAEVNKHQEKGHIIGMSEAIESRDASVAKKGDIVVAQTNTGRKVLESHTDVNTIDLGDETIIESDGKIIKGEDIYYKGDALLLLMVCNPDSKVLKQIRKSLQSDNPVITPYNLDPEMQIVLLTLLKDTGVESMHVNANSPEVATLLTKKSARYPNVLEAARLKTDINTPDPISGAKATQKREWELSVLARKTGYHLDEIPGYWIGAGADTESQLWLALTLHSSRYGFQHVYGKPVHGTDGGGQEKITIGHVSRETRERIINKINTGDIDSAVEEFRENLGENSDLTKQVKKIARKSIEENIDWVIEANVEIFNFDFVIDQAEEEIHFLLETLPATYLTHAQVSEYLSVQLNDGSKEWGGNYICTEENWIRILEIAHESGKITKDEMQDLSKAHQILRTKMKDFVKHVNNSTTFNEGLVRGSYDAIIGKLGGDFGGEIVIGMGDPNLRANGTESAAMLSERAKQKYGQHGSAVTRNFAPNHDYETTIAGIGVVLDQLNKKYDLDIDPDRIVLVGLSDGWAQIGLIGENGLSLVSEILIVEKEMRLNGLAK